MTRSQGTAGRNAFAHGGRNFALLLFSPLQQQLPARLRCSLRYGVNLRARRGFNPNLLLAAWHTWAAQLHLAIDVQPRLDGWLEGDRLEGKWLNCPHSHCWNANSPPRAEKKAPSLARGTLRARGKRSVQ